MIARIAILQLPGVNCETETRWALERAGLEAEIFCWTRPGSELRDFQGYVIPGGFSYQDRVRAGALAAKSPLLQTLAEEAARGKPLLGICNGAQVLVEAGLVPGGGRVELALARNRMPRREGYYSRWVRIRIESSPCVFTHGIEPGSVLPMPVAHGEGRFTGAPGHMAALHRGGQVPLRYADVNGEPARTFPDLPNGSESAAAAVCNGRGNVLAMMPHPERALDRGAVARAIGGPWSAGLPGAAGGEGPGSMLFAALRGYLVEA